MKQILELSLAGYYAIQMFRSLSLDNIKKMWQNRVIFKWYISFGQIYRVLSSEEYTIWRLGTMR